MFAAGKDPKLTTASAFCLHMKLFGCWQIQLLQLKNTKNVLIVFKEHHRSLVFKVSLVQCSSLAIISQEIIKVLVPLTTPVNAAFWWAASLTWGETRLEIIRKISLWMFVSFQEMTESNIILGVHGRKNNSITLHTNLKHVSLEASLQLWTKLTINSPKAEASNQLNAQH